MKCLVILSAIVLFLVNVEAKYVADRDNHENRILSHLGDDDWMEEWVNSRHSDPEQSQQNEDPEELLKVSKVNKEIIINLSNPDKIQEIMSKLNIKTEVSMSMNSESVGEKGPSYSLVQNEMEKHRYEMLSDKKEASTFVWKTVKSRDDINLDDLIWGTYEENTATKLITETMFGRIVFNENYKLMAKVLPYTSIKFFAAMGGKTFDVNDFTKFQGYNTEDGTYNALDHFEVLTNPHKVGYKWFKSEKLPENAVECGIENDQVYYCGRMNLGKGMFPAKITNGMGYTHYFTVRSSTQFEYLVYDY